MGERINRQDDENLYQPKIHSRRIRSLYRISDITSLPMTVLLDLAIKEFIEKYQVNFDKSQNPIDTNNLMNGDGGDML